MSRGNSQLANRLVLWLIGWNLTDFAIEAKMARRHTLDYRDPDEQAREEAHASRVAEQEARHRAYIVRQWLHVEAEDDLPFYEFCRAWGVDAKALQRWLLAAVGRGPLSTCERELRPSWYDGNRLRAAQRKKNLRG